MDKITAMAEFLEEAERLDPDGFAKARAERAERAEMETLRKDAERYRWLRAQHWNDGRLAVVADPKGAIKLGHDCPSFGRLDEQIDAEMLVRQAVGAMPAAPGAPVLGVAMCPECGCAGCNGECAGDDMMGD